MKKLIIVLFIGLLLPVVGCGMLKQSNAAHHAIEDQGYDVDKVVVQVKNGRKTVAVHTLAPVSDEDIDHIKAITKEKIPDANKVVVHSPGGKKKKAKPVKGNPPVKPVKGKPPVKGGPPVS